MGDPGGIGEEFDVEVRLRLSIAGKEGFVLLALRVAVTVAGSWLRPVGRAGFALVELNWPPNVRVETDCALCMAICLW